MDGRWGAERPAHADHGPDYLVPQSCSAETCLVPGREAITPIFAARLREAVEQLPDLADEDRVKLIRWSRQLDRCFPFKNGRRCKRQICPKCAARRARTLRRQLQARQEQVLAEGGGLALLTLTLAPRSQSTSSASLRADAKTLAALAAQLRRSRAWIAAVHGGAVFTEFSAGTHNGSPMAHLHALVEIAKEGIDRDGIDARWQSILDASGRSGRLHVKRIDKPWGAEGAKNRRTFGPAAFYVSKRVRSEWLALDLETFAALVLAHDGMRTVARVGTWRSCASRRRPRTSTARPAPHLAKAPKTRHERPKPPRGPIRSNLLPASVPTARALFSSGPAELAGETPTVELQIYARREQVGDVRRDLFWCQERLAEARRHFGSGRRDARLKPRPHLGGAEPVPKDPLARALKLGGRGELWGHELDCFRDLAAGRRKPDAFRFDVYIRRQQALQVRSRLKRREPALLYLGRGISSVRWRTGREPLEDSFGVELVQMVPCDRVLQSSVLIEVGRKDLDHLDHSALVGPPLLPVPVRPVMKDASKLGQPDPTLHLVPNGSARSLEWFLGLDQLAVPGARLVVPELRSRRGSRRGRTKKCELRVADGKETELTLCRWPTRRHRDAAYR